jgi:excisionase family DNA binding protein
MSTRLAVTIPEACELAHLSRSTLYQAIKRGDLIARKYRRRTLILRSDLENFLAKLPASNGGAS